MRLQFGRREADSRTVREPFLWFFLSIPCSRLANKREMREDGSCLHYWQFYDMSTGPKMNQRTPRLHSFSLRWRWARSLAIKLSNSVGARQRRKRERARLNCLSSEDLFLSLSHCPPNGRETIEPKLRTEDVGIPG